MKLEVGMYVRTINGKIWIITSQKAISGHRKDIIKASYNIIDLIEVGDYVNGYEVTSKDQFLGFGNHDWYMTNDEIKSIVTQEQMEQMAYKVGD